MKLSQKIIIFLALLFFFLLLSNFVWQVDTFSQRELEVEYPEVSGFKPVTVTTPLPDYVKYIFNLSIAIIGLIGLAVLIWAGIGYLTSAGDAIKQKTAKKQILSAFLGILVLLFSYLILTTINPQLVILTVPGTQVPPDEIPPVEREITRAPDLLWRIGKIAETVRNLAERIKQLNQELRTLTNRCNCLLAQSKCLCKDYQGSCQGVYCYVGPGSSPCPNPQKIREGQQENIVLKSEILYYKNVILAEEKDFTVDVEKLENEIKYYEKRIVAEEAAGNPTEELKRIRDKLKKEKEEKERLAKRAERKEFKNLAQLIEQIAPLLSEMSELIDECWSAVKDKCQPVCVGGCHDTLGCFPAPCVGLPPCPTIQIATKVSRISNLANNIIQSTEKIMSTTEEIRKIEEPVPPPPPEPLPPDPGVTPPNYVKFASDLIRRQWPHASPQLRSLIACIYEKYPAAVITSISDSKIIQGEKTFSQCKTCPKKCVHSCTSYHYGRSCGNQSYAVDMRSRGGVGPAIIAAAKACQAFYLDEGDHIHIDTRYHHPCK